jgi:hypothetical protein
MTAHPEDRAHKSEGRVATHNEVRGSKRRANWDIEQTVLQDKVCTSVICDTPYVVKRVKIPSDLSWLPGTRRLTPC